MDKNDWYGLYQFHVEIAAGLQQRDQMIEELKKQLDATKISQEKK